MNEIGRGNLAAGFAFYCLGKAAAQPLAAAPQSRNRRAVGANSRGELVIGHSVAIHPFRKRHAGDCARDAHRCASTFCASRANDSRHPLRQPWCMARKARAAERRSPGHFLRAWRDYRGLSQDKLGERAGLSHGQISRLENGVSELREDTLARLAAALRVPPEAMYRAPQEHNGLAVDLAHRIMALPQGERDALLTIIDGLTAAKGS